MKLHFTYDIEKDIENILKGTKAVNSKQPTKFQNLYTEKYGSDFNPDKIKEFIVEQDFKNNVNMGKEIKDIEEKWKTIESIFIERAEKIFKISYPASKITVYLTHNERCTYNIEENYFFVKIGSRFSNNTIMHELFHFYTWHAFGKKLINEGFSKNKYNDIKESLTELLNIEFSDLMGGKKDKGYVQHENIRAEIRTLWITHEDLALIIKKLVSVNMAE